MVDLFHHNEIARAVRLLCQSSVALTQDTDGTDTVWVGSNELFAVNDTVELLDDDTSAEQHQVAAKVGLTKVQLDEVVTGTFTVANNAALRLAPAVLPDLKWVGQGSPEIMPQPPDVQFPAIVVQPATLEQPIGDGTNRSFRQDYHYLIYYLCRPAIGDPSNPPMLEESGKLFNLLMQDMYLGGSCWYSQVIRLEPAPKVQQQFLRRDIPVSVVELELVARRLETP